MVFTGDDYMALLPRERAAVDRWLLAHWLVADRVVRLRFSKGRVIATELVIGRNDLVKVRGVDARTIERGVRLCRPFPVDLRVGIDEAFRWKAALGL